MGKAYSFMKYGHEEIHIFQGYFHLDHSCDAGSESICKKIKIDQGKWFDEHICKSADEARVLAAKIGKNVCATCVQKLYSDY